MANSFTSERDEIVGTMDSTGVSDSIIVKAGNLLDISINFATNSFSGTILLERRTRTGTANAYVWSTVETYTTDTEKVAESGAGRRYRLNCTVAGGGTAGIQLRTT
jgi:hypothetical protein